MHTWPPDVINTAGVTTVTTGRWYDNDEAALTLNTALRTPETDTCKLVTTPYPATVPHDITPYQLAFAYPTTSQLLV